MDRTERLISNRGTRRILLRWLLLTAAGLLGAWLLSGLLADRIIAREISAMLSAAGGGSFPDAPQPEAVAAAEQLYAGTGISQKLAPVFMYDYIPVRRMLFFALAGFALLLTALVSLPACRDADRIYRTLDSIAEECVQLSEDSSRTPALRGSELGSMRRVSEGIRRLAERTGHTADALRAEKDGLSRFLADFTHQMKGSLAVIRLNQDMLSGMTLPEAERTRLDREISEELDSMEQLVLETLKLAKLDAAAVRYTMTDTDLAATCTAAVRRTAPLMRQKGIRVLTDFPDDPETVSMPHDGPWICEAAENLLRNAAEHADCTAVTVALEPLPGAVRLSVTDNGAGMPPETVRRLFDRFHAGTGRRSTGIGMSVARRVFAAHGGALTVFSSPGSGTQFLVIFSGLPD